MKPTAAEIAAWMLHQLDERGGALYQDEAVAEISSEFGASFVYENDAGNLAISRTVLAEFRKLTEDRVVWIRSERFWRWRQESDDPEKRESE